MPLGRRRSGDGSRRSRSAVAGLPELHQDHAGQDQRAAHELHRPWHLAEEQPGEGQREEHLVERDERGEPRARAGARPRCRSCRRPRRSPRRGRATAAHHGTWRAVVRRRAGGPRHVQQPDHTEQQQRDARPRPSRPRRARSAAARCPPGPTARSRSRRRASPAGAHSTPTGSRPTPVTTSRTSTSPAPATTQPTPISRPGRWPWRSHSQRDDRRPGRCTRAAARPRPGGTRRR